MDLLDRLLKHDQWTTGQFLALAQALTEEELDRPFDLGLKTVRQTLIHMIANTICWTRLMTDTRPFDPAIPDAICIKDLCKAFDRISEQLYVFARQVTDNNGLDQTFIDQLDDPPRRKTFGAGFVHIATHNMHHRAQLLFMFRRLGVADLPEGDAIGWERQHVGGWEIT